jgi:hypothetical protein
VGAVAAGLPAGVEAVAGEAVSVLAGAEVPVGEAVPVLAGAEVRAGVELPAGVALEEVTVGARVQLGAAEGQYGPQGKVMAGVEPLHGALAGAAAGERDGKHRPGVPDGRAQAGAGAMEAGKQLRTCCRFREGGFGSGTLDGPG